MQYFLAADEDSGNSVVVKVLQLLTVLIKFGYYDDSTDVNPLLPSIHKLLDGSGDYPTNPSEGKEGKKRESDMRESNNLRTRTYHFLAYKVQSTRRSNSSFWFKRPLMSSDVQLPRIRKDTIDLAAHAMTQEASTKFEKALRKFHDEGGRYAYTQDKHNYFEIKRWSVIITTILTCYTYFTGPWKF